MTVLSGKALRARLQSKDLTDRLVVAPLLEPAEQLRDDQASIDVRLGFQFATLRTSSLGMIDELAYHDALNKAKHLASAFSPRYVPLGEGIAIHPHQFVLASTLEYLRLPPNLTAFVVGRSTWGRLGLIVATAVGIQPLFAGTLTLELRNLGEAPLKVYPGQSMAQLFFHNVEDVSCADDSASGQYLGSVDLVPRRLSTEASLRKLKELEKRRIR